MFTDLELLSASLATLTDVKSFASPKLCKICWAKSISFLFSVAALIFKKSEILFFKQETYLKIYLMYFDNY